MSTDPTAEPDFEKDEPIEFESPSVVFAVLIAARKTGDVLLENIARKQLLQKHRVKVSFLAE